MDWTEHTWHLSTGHVYLLIGFVCCNPRSKAIIKNLFIFPYWLVERVPVGFSLRLKSEMQARNVLNIKLYPVCSTERGPLIIFTKINGKIFRIGGSFGDFGGFYSLAPPPRPCTNIDWGVSGGDLHLQRNARS